MKVLVTGSGGHLGEALIRTLLDTSHEVIGLDKIVSPYTSSLGSIADREFVRHYVQGVDAIIHAAALHKPHVVTHTRQSFIDTNLTGTLNLLEEAVAAGVSALVFTSTTGAFGAALTPSPGAAAVSDSGDTSSARPHPSNPMTFAICVGTLHK